MRAACRVLCVGLLSVVVVCWFVVVWRSLFVVCCVLFARWLLLAVRCQCAVCRVSLCLSCDCVLVACCVLFVFCAVLLLAVRC